RRSPCSVNPRCSPTWPASVSASSAARATSTAPARTASFAARRLVVSTVGITSGVELVGDGAHDGGDLRRLGALRVATGAEPVAGPVEQLDEVLDDRDHVLGRLALGARHRRRRVEHRHRERLLAATAVGDAELHPRARARRRGARRHRGRVEEDLTAVVGRDETEAAVGVEELDLAGGHVFLPVGDGARVSAPTARSRWTNHKRTCVRGRYRSGPVRRAGVGAPPPGPGTSITTMAGTTELADLFREADDDWLAALLADRPDLARPMPQSLTALASQAGSRASASRALATSTAPEVTVLEAVVTLTASGGTTTLAALADALGGAAVAPVVERLRTRALLLGDDETLAAAPGVPGAGGPTPLGPGPPLRALDVRADAGWPTTPSALRTVLADAPEGARRLLDALTWGPPVGTLGTELPPAARWLL